MTEIETMTEAIFDAVKGYVEQQTSSLMRKVRELEERLANLPVPKDGEAGKDAVVDYEKILNWCADNLKPMDGVPGRDGEAGKDAVIDYDLIRNEIVELIPAPILGKDGKDAVIDYEKITDWCATYLVPKDGKDGVDGVGKDGKDAVVDYDLIRSEIAKMIPEPIPGKDGVNGKDAIVDYGIIFGQIKELIPDPIPGKDGVNGKDAVIDEAQLLRIVQDFVNLEVGKIPKAKDGKDAVVDYDLIRSEIAKMIPEPIAGENGRDGRDGRDGADGKSVDLVDLQIHVTDAVQKAVAALPPAEPGECGLPGVNGRDAVVDYDQVEKIIAKMIPPVKDGERGESGVNGRDGAPGRDALEIEPLSEIDFTRSYARRTYALHNGGLWIARRSMPGIESWECVVPGIAGVDFWQDENDARIIGLSVTRSDGTVAVLKKSIPVMLHRGQWKPGAYKHGDVVIRDGSSWHAQRDTESQPGSGPDWQLIVKRGQPGRDAVPVIHDEKNKVVRLK